MKELNRGLESLRLEPVPRPTRSRRYLWIPAALAPAALAAYLLVAGAGTEPPAAASESSHGDQVSAARVPGSPGSPILTASGYLVARREALVSATQPGRLAELRVDEGSTVSQGEILARLESRQQQASLERARAQLLRAAADRDEAARKLRVAEALCREGLLPADQLEAARSEERVGEASVALARAEVGYAEATLETTIIRAPFDGTVLRKLAEVGESMAPAPPGANSSTASAGIVVLAALDTLEFEADITESGLETLVLGKRAEVVLDAFPDRRYQGLIRQIDPAADRTKATVQVNVALSETDPDLRPELSGRVSFFELPAA